MSNIVRIYKHRTPYPFLWRHAILKYYNYTSLNHVWISEQHSYGDANNAVVRCNGLQWHMFIEPSILVNTITKINNNEWSFFVVLNSRDFTGSRFTYYDCNPYIYDKGNNTIVNLSTPTYLKQWYIASMDTVGLIDLVFFTSVTNDMIHAMMEKGIFSSIYTINDISTKIENGDRAYELTNVTSPSRHVGFDIDEHSVNVCNIICVQDQETIDIFKEYHKQLMEIVKSNFIDTIDTVKHMCRKRLTLDNNAPIIQRAVMNHITDGFMDVNPLGDILTDIDVSDFDTTPYI